VNATGVMGHHDRENPFFRLFDWTCAWQEIRERFKKARLWRAEFWARRISHSWRIPLSSPARYSFCEGTLDARSFSPARARTLSQGIPPRSRTAKMRDSSASEKPSVTRAEPQQPAPPSAGVQAVPCELRAGVADIRCARSAAVGPCDPRHWASVPERSHLRPQAASQTVRVWTLECIPGSSTLLDGWK